MGLCTNSTYGVDTQLGVERQRPHDAQQFAVFIHARARVHTLRCSYAFTVLANLCVYALLLVMLTTNPIVDTSNVANYRNTALIVTAIGSYSVLIYHCGIRCEWVVVNGPHAVT
jgi:hypothetical protein